MSELRFGRVPNLRRFGILPRVASLALLISIGLAWPSPAQDFEQLGKDLSSGDRDVRREAAFQLRELGAKSLPALPALIGALRDDDEQVAARAITAIARIGPEAGEAIPALIDIMDPERRRYNGQVIYRSAYALSEIGKQAVDPLREALKSSRDGQRSGAALALQLMGAPAAPAIPELIRALHDGESEVALAAAEALGAIGKPALEPLQRDLKESSKAAAVYAIGLIGKPAAGASVQLLELIAASKEDDALHAEILQALGAIEVPFAQLKAPLRAALTGESDAVRRAAASVLLSYPQPGEHSLPALKAWLADESAGLRSRAVWVVGQFGADAADLAADLIGQLEKGDDVETITAALAGLGSRASGAVMQAVAETPLAELQNGEPHWARTVLKSSGPLALPALETALDSEHASIRFVALDGLTALGKIARPLVPRFRKATSDPEPAVRLAALIALESAGAEAQRLATILHRRCADESGAVRAVAVRLLGQGGDRDPQAFELIDQALADSDAAVRRAAIAALGKFGAGAEGSVPKLLELASGADAQTKLAILKTLSVVGTRAGDALPLVKESLSDADPQVRGAAIAALVAIEPDGESLPEVLSKMLADDDQAVRHPAIRGLGQRGEAAKSAAPQLFALLEDAEDRAPALEALGRIRSRDVDLYIVALENSEPRVRLFACEALGRLGKEAEKAIPQLESARKDRYDFVRQRADDALRRIRR